MKAPDLYVGKQLQVGDEKPDVFGRGPTQVRGSASIKGPEMVGDASQFPGTPAGGGNPFEIASLMAGQTGNAEMIPPPFYSFIATSFARIKSFLKVDQLLTVKIIKSKIIYAEVIMAKVKNFAIPHPTQPNTKLVYACLEGPENGVYVRGVLKGSDVINLPDVWSSLVDPASITVSLTPVGSDQGLIIRGVTNNKIKVQARPGVPIWCHYHVFAERKDVEKLKTEVSV